MMLILIVMLAASSVALPVSLYIVFGLGNDWLICTNIAMMVLIGYQWTNLFRIYTAWRDARRRGWNVSRKEFLLYWNQTHTRASLCDPEELRGTPAYVGLSDFEILNRADLIIERNSMERAKEEKASAVRDGSPPP